MIITFFGHSQFPHNECYKRKLVDLLREKVGDNSVDFYLGGYGKFDDLAYNCCKEYKSTHTNASLIFITPYITLEYQKNYLKDRITKYDEIIYPEIENKPLRFAISYRNKWMVDKADCIICGIFRHSGGAYKAYQYAKQNKKQIFNIAEFL